MTPPRPWATLDDGVNKIIREDSGVAQRVEPLADDVDRNKLTEGQRPKEDDSAFKDIDQG